MPNALQFSGVSILREDPRPLDDFAAIAERRYINQAFEFSEKIARIVSITNRLKLDDDDYAFFRKRFLRRYRRR